MRTLNVPFALGLLAVLAAIGTGTFFLHRYQLDRISADLLWQADRSRDAGKPDEAAIHVYRYLEFKPDDIKAIEQLIGWLDNEPEARRPSGELARLLNCALRIQPERDDLRRRVVGLNLRLGQFGDCLDHLESLLQAKPNDAELLRWLGECKQRTGRHSDAARAYERAIQGDTKQAISYIKYASLLVRQLARPDEARRILENGIVVLPADASLRLALARLLRYAGNNSLARTAIEAAVALAPNDASILAFAADLHQVEGDRRRARELYQQACAADPANTKYECALVWLMLCDGQTTEASSRVLRVLRDNPNNIDAIILLGDIGVRTGKPELLDQMIDEIARQPANGPLWLPDYLSARLSLYRGRFEDALGKLEKLRVDAVKLPGLVSHATYLMAECHEQLGDHAAEVDAYRRLCEAEPGSGYYRIQLTRALARAGQLDKAASEFRIAIGHAELPASTVRATLIDLVERCQIAHADHVLLDLERAMARIQPTDESANAVLAKVELLRLRRRNDDALRICDAFIRRNANNASMYSARVRVLEALHGSDAALTAEAESRSRCDDQVDLVIARMNILAKQAGRSAGGNALIPNAELDQLSLNDRTHALMEKISCCGMVGDQAQLQLALKHLSNIRLDHSGVRSVLLTLALAADESDRVARLLSELQEIEGPNGWLARRFHAESVVALAAGDASKCALARQMLEDLAKERPREPVVQFLLGRVDEIEGRDSAIEHYRGALDFGFLDQPIEGHFWAIASAGTSVRVQMLLDSPLVERLRLDQDRAIIRPIIGMAVATNRHDVVDRFLAAHVDGTAPQLNWLGKLFQQHGLTRQAEAAFAAAARPAPRQLATRR